MAAAPVPSPDPDPWFRFGPLPLSPLLDAALATFTEHGYHGASVRDIAQRVGVTVPTLYYHHGSKQGLLVALLEASIEDLTSRLDRATQGTEHDPVEQLAALVACTVLFTCHRPSIAWLDAEARYLDAEARARYVQPRQDLERRFLAVLEQGRRDGAFPITEPAVRLRALLGALQSIAIWYQPGGRLSPVDVATTHVAFALDAMRVEPARSDPAVDVLRRVISS